MLPDNTRADGHPFLFEVPGHPGLLTPVKGETYDQFAEAVAVADRPSMDELILQADAALGRALPANFDPVTHHKLGERWEHYGSKVKALRDEYGQEIDAETLYSVRRWAEIRGDEPRPFHIWPGNAEIMRDARAAYGPRLTNEAAYVQGQREYQATGGQYHAPMPAPSAPFLAAYLSADSVPPANVVTEAGDPDDLSPYAEKIHDLLVSIETRLDLAIARASAATVHKPLPSAGETARIASGAYSREEPTGWENLRLAWAYGPTRALLIVCGVSLGYGSVQFVATLIGLVTS